MYGLVSITERVASSACVLLAAPAHVIFQLFKTKQHLHIAAVINSGTVPRVLAGSTWQCEQAGAARRRLLRSPLLQQYLVYFAAAPVADATAPPCAAVPVFECPRCLLGAAAVAV